ncbi:ABC transporter substrate-binding protein [Quadrisphaera oryzae]|uniref:ABC transporter substrate-binding protein n=1 Tax=Quadrisphaera TaxID=317661 RepID=UPI0016460EAA|nr:sugar ABC transporter substrate-binding protein [Quadrisphaera sp. RL12-1S]MBC3762682.1 sugar ABC transporter substrate-binding protein [Quadrisphaera sp. RL12-1S]
MRNHTGRLRGAIAAVAVAGLAIGLAACGGGSASSPGASASVTSPEGTDDGTKLTLWTRAPLELQAKALVQAYNSTHKNQVDLTVVPNDDYVTKVGAAAGSGGLPDLFAADIVYVPNWTSQGLFKDITANIDALPEKDSINKGHLSAGTYEDKEYVLPFVLDLSVMMWNKTLYKEAGLDPDKGPTTLAEFTSQAEAVQKLGKADTYGTYFGGNCGGCNVFTWFPMVWASGQDVMNPEGTQSKLDGEAAQQVYSTWHDLNAAGAIAPGAKDETGATWTAAFQKGQVGVMPYPATLLSTVAKTVDVGVAPIPGVNGGGSTFIGGDGIGISKDSKASDQAWNFLSWLMSEKAQVDVLAKNGTTPSRSDLADNQYSQADPRLAVINKVASAADSKTPYAPNFQTAFNAAGSPWLTLLRDQVYGTPDASRLKSENDAITAALAG